jgi:hypothetical protein
LEIQAAGRKGRSRPWHLDIGRSWRGPGLDFLCRRRELTSLFDSMVCLYARFYAPERNWRANETQWGQPESAKKRPKTEGCPSGSKLRGEMGPGA